MLANRIDYYRLFKKQYGDLPVGGFINPEIVGESDTRVLFRCHYDNYESDEDVWYYGLDLASKTFYAE